MPPSTIRQSFAARFGSEPQIVCLAPGRVNLIGEHTDYNDGFVFPAAIDKGLYLAASISNDGSKLFSEQLGPGEAFEVGKVEPKQIQDWAKYPAGMGWVLRRDRPDLPDLASAIDSDIPIGSGVSSSAAIEMAYGVAWNHLVRLGIPNQRLAILGQVCENEFVGVNSGIMDQMASAMGKAGHAMFLDTRSLEIRHVPVPDTLAVVLLDTNKPRALTESAYNERRSQCEQAAATLGVPKLRDATLEDLESAQSKMPDVIYRRARHVIGENRRCIDFVDALESGDLGRIGTLMRQSHESLRDDYEVSCRELDAMSEAAWQTEGCVGARMTGAGFGGACVALVDNTQVDPFIASVLAKYEQAVGMKGEAMACRIADGARVLEG